MIRIKDERNPSNRVRWIQSSASHPTPAQTWAGFAWVLRVMIHSNLFWWFSTRWRERKISTSVHARCRSGWRETWTCCVVRIWMKKLVKAVVVDLFVIVLLRLLCLRRYNNDDDMMIYIGLDESESVQRKSRVLRNFFGFFTKFLLIRWLGWVDSARSFFAFDA